MSEEQKPLTPLKAIKARCTECSGDSEYERRLCPCTDCALYPYRNGKNPYIKPRQLTDEQKRANAERLKQWRENQNKTNT